MVAGIIETSTDKAVGDRRMVLRLLERAINAVVIIFAFVLCLPITVNWVTLCVGLVLWLLAMAARAACKQPLLRLAPLTLPLAVYAAIVTISGAYNGGIREIFPSLLSLRPMIVYLWAYDAFARNRRIQMVAVGAMLSLAMISGYWGTVQQVTGYHPYGFQFLQGTGFLSGPMDFAGQMQLFSLLSASLFFSRAFRVLPSPFSSAPVFAAITAGNVLGVIFASERSAWAGFICGALVLAVFGSIRFAVKSAAFASIVAVAAWHTLPVFKKRLLPLLDPMHDVSTRARLIIWEQAWQKFVHHPLLGIGVRKFPHVYIPEALVPGQAKYLSHAHSNYMQVLATTGLAGIACYLWLLCATLKLCLQQFLRNRWALGRHSVPGVAAFDGAVGLGLFAAVVSLSVAGIFEYNFGTSHVRLAEWFLLALLIPRPR